MHSRFDSLVDSWLLKADRWIEQDRDKPIEVLILEYVLNERGEATGRGWDELPSKLRSHFGGTARSNHRLAKGRFMSFAYRGDMGGWRDLFGEIDKASRLLVRLEPSDHMDRMDSLDHWALTLFHLGRVGAFDRVQGGKPMSLDPGLSVIVGGATLTDARFNIDGFGGENLAPMKKLMRESAEKHGWYAHFHDIRMATVTTIRWLQTKQAEAANTDRLSLPQLLNEILIALDEGVAFEGLYPLLRRVEALRVTVLGETAWPGCLIRLRDGYFQLATKHPHLDEHYDAEWDASKKLTPDENDKLRFHIKRVVGAWLRFAEMRIAAGTDGKLTGKAGRKQAEAGLVADSNESSADDGSDSTESHDEQNAKYLRLELLTPKLDDKSVEWIESNRRNYEIFKIGSGTLRKYREIANALYVAPDKMFGVDRDGRIWRRKPGKNNPEDGRVFYLRSSLPKP
ncbi:MAG: hypothetical protein F9B45_14860 [Phycisphaera sp. RhM]|nr:hypothetical protein [Phycisphaera sp. RhM]